MEWEEWMWRSDSSVVGVAEGSQECTVARLLAQAQMVGLLTP